MCSLFLSLRHSLSFPLIICYPNIVLQYVWITILEKNEWNGKGREKKKKGREVKEKYFCLFRIKEKEEEDK